jgi:hypothetical protein
MNEHQGPRRILRQTGAKLEPGKTNLRTGIS